MAMATPNTQPLPPRFRKPFQLEVMIIRTDYEAHDQVVPPRFRKCYPNAKLKVQSSSNLKNLKKVEGKRKRKRSERRVSRVQVAFDVSDSDVGGPGDQETVVERYVLFLTL